MKSFKPGDVYKNKKLFYFMVITEKDYLRYYGLDHLEGTALEHCLSRPSLKDAVFVKTLGLNWGHGIQAHNPEYLKQQEAQKVDTSKPYDVNEFQNLDTSVCPKCSGKYR